MKGRGVWYEKSDFEQILKATGKQLRDDQRESFLERLEEIATAFLQDYGIQKRDPPHAVAKRLDTIASVAEKLVRLIKSTDGVSAKARLHAQAMFYRRMRVRTRFLNAKGEPEEHIEPSQFPTVEDAIRTIESLRLYATQAAARERPKVKTDKKRYQGNKARQTFVNNLAGLWAEVFEELPGASVNPTTGKPGGPFIRFLVACYMPLRREFPTLPELDEMAARAHYRRTAEARLKRYFS